MQSVQAEPGTTSNVPHASTGNAALLVFAIARIAREAQDGSDLTRAQQQLYVIDQLARKAGVELDRVLIALGKAPWIGDYAAWEDAE